MTDRRLFGEWLEDSYTAAGFTQTAFAEAIGYHQTTVSAWVNGVRQVKRRRAARAIAQALKMDEDEVFARAKIKRADPRPGESETYSASDIADTYNRLEPDEQRLFRELLELIADRSEEAPQ